ncbi:MAG: DPP IV N-terminal domain-containing protein [Phycisphaerae bacterium]|jgi:Tol biopolymer transport system component
MNAALAHSRRLLVASIPLMLLQACGTTSRTSGTTPSTDTTATIEPADHRPAPSHSAAAIDSSQAATTNITRVTFAEEGADFDPCISPDGKLLVFASTQHRATSDIYFKRTDTRVVTQLTNDPADDAMPSISPDGTKIAFASNRSGNWDIFVMPIFGGRPVQVTNDPADELHATWSPDGKSLVYTRAGAGGRWEMWVTKAGSEATPHFIGFGLQPKWCPVGGTGANGADKILFQLGRERGHRSYSLWTLDYAEGVTSNVTEVAGGSELAIMNPGWSPDGRWITFAQADILDPDNALDQPRKTSLWIATVQGEGRVRLTGSDGSVLSPAWSRSDTLFFVSDRTGTENIWSLNLAPAIAAAKASIPGSSAAASASTDAATSTTATADDSTANQDSK